MSYKGNYQCKNSFLYVVLFRFGNSNNNINNNNDNENNSNPLKVPQNHYHDGRK